MFCRKKKPHWVSKRFLFMWWRRSAMTFGSFPPALPTSPLSRKLLVLRYRGIMVRGMLMYWFPFKKLNMSLTLEIMRVKVLFFVSEIGRFSPLVNSAWEYIYGTHDLSRFVELSLKTGRHSLPTTPHPIFPRSLARAWWDANDPPGPSCGPVFKTTQNAYNWQT